MGEELTFRRYQKADIPQLSKLIKQIFGDERNTQYLTWKYDKNPAGKAVSAIAEKEGEVIGQVGAIPLRFYINGKEYLATQEVDGCLDKDKGKFDTIFHLIRLRQKINEEENIPFTYFFSIAISSKIALRSERNKKVCPTPVLVKITDSEPFLNRKIPVKGLAKILALPANYFLRLWYPSNKALPKGTQLRELETFDARFDSFWERFKDDYAFMTVRDCAYLNWRYVQIPERKYKILALEEKKTDEILGFIVLCESLKEIKIGRILEIATLKNGPEKATRFLLGEAMRHFHKKRVSVILCWMLPHCHIFKELSRLGFQSRENEGVDLIYRSTFVENPVIPIDFATNKENWYICMGDADFY